MRLSISLIEFLFFALDFDQSRKSLLREISSGHANKDGNSFSREILIFRNV